MEGILRSRSRQAAKNEQAAYMQHMSRIGATADDIPDDIIAFVDNLPLGFGRIFTFTEREWLKAVLRDRSKVIAVLKSRQVGWSVLLSVLMCWYALKYPGIEIMYCTMREDTFRYFMQRRLRPILGKKSKMGRNEDRIKSVELANGSLITLISGHDGFTAARGYSVDILFLDEAEKLPINDLTNIRETMSASKIGRMYIGGTGGIEGQPWPAYTAQCNMREWSKKDHKWNDSMRAKDAAAAEDISGYHITQSMLPGWTPEAQEKKRNEPGMTPATFEMEILGIHTSLADVPLSLETVEACLDTTKQTWYTPAEIRRRDNLICTIDLAAGGTGSDTVVEISRLNDDDTTTMLEAYRSLKKRHTEIYAEIKPVIDRWNCPRMYSDAGGNEPLLDLIMADYDCIPLRLAAPKRPAKYQRGEPPVISHSYAIGQCIERFHAQKIDIPDTGERWITDHLTAITREESSSRTGADSVIYRKSGKNDLLMCQAFIEAVKFMDTDPENPANRRIGMTGPDDDEDPPGF